MEQCDAAFQKWLWLNDALSNVALLSKGFVNLITLGPQVPILASQHWGIENKA